MARSNSPTKKLWRKASMEAKEMVNGLPDIKKQQLEKPSSPKNNGEKRLKFAFPPVSSKSAVIVLETSAPIISAKFKGGTVNPAVAKHYGKKIPPVAQRIETASSEFQSYMSSRVNNSPQNHGHYYYNTRTFGTPSKKSNFHQQHNEFMNEEEEDPFPPPPLQSTEPPHETREESDEESQSESAHDSADAIVAQLLAGSSIPQRLPSSNFSGVQTSSKSVIATTEAEISTSGKGSVVSTNSVSVLSAQPEFSDINSLLTMLYDGSSSRRGSVMKHPSDDFSNKKKAVGKTIDGMILAEEDDVEIREGGADEDEEVIQERQYKLLTTVEHKLNMLEPNRVNSAFGAATFSAGRKTTGFGNMPLRPLVKRSSASFSAKKRKTAQWKRMARVLKDTNQRMKDSLNRDGTIMCRFQKMEQKRNVNLPLGINASCFGLRRGFFNEVHTQNPSVNAPLSRPHTQADCAQLTSFENTSSPLRVFKDSSHYYKSESYKYYADAFKQKGISLEETGITHLSSQPSLTSKTVAFGSDYLGFAVTDHHLDDSTTTKKSSSSITESTITEEDVMESSFTSAKDGEDVEGIVTTVMINKSDADGDEQDGETGDEVAINEIQEELSSNDNLSSEKSLGKSNIDEAEIVSALTVDKELNSFPTPPNDQLSNEDVASTPKNHQLDLIASTKDCIIEGWNEADEAPVNQVPEQSSTSIGKNSLQANDIIYTLNAASSSHSSHQVAIISKKATSPLAPRERVFFPTDLNQVIVIKTKKFVIPEGLPVQIQAAIKYSFLLEKAIKLIQRIAKGYAARSKYKKTIFTAKVIQRWFRVRRVREMFLSRIKMSENDDSKRLAVQEMSDLAYRCSLKMKTPGNLNTAWKHYVHHITETRNQLDLIKCNILPSTSSRLQLWSDFGKYTPLMIAKYTTPLAVNSKEAAGRVKRNGDSSSNSQKTSNSVTTPQSPYYGFSEEGLSSRLTPVAHSRASQSRGKSRGTSAVAVLDPVSSPMKISRSVIFTPRSRQASVTATGISTITTETAGDHTLSIPSSLADNITNLLTPQNLNVDWLVQLMISLGSTLETEEQGDELDIVISDQSQSAAESSSKIEEIFE